MQMSTDISNACITCSKFDSLQFLLKQYYCSFATPQIWIWVNKVIKTKLSINKVIQMKLYSNLLHLILYTRTYYQLKASMLEII